MTLGMSNKQKKNNDDNSHGKNETAEKIYNVQANGTMIRRLLL